MAEEISQETIETFTIISYYSLSLAIILGIFMLLKDPEKFVSKVLMGYATSYLRKNWPTIMRKVLLGF